MTRQAEDIDLRQAASAVPGRRFAWVALCWVWLAWVGAAGCADKYTLEGYVPGAGGEIDSPYRAQPGTFHFSSDAGPWDGSSDRGGRVNDAAWGVVDAGVGEGGPDDVASTGAQDTASPGDQDAADADADGDGDGQPWVGLDIAVCSHGACVAASDCSGELVGLASCNLVVCAEGCCQIATAPVGSPCDDGDACTVDDTCGGVGCVGKAKDCDDGLTCTQDACAQTDGACSHTVGPGWCEIDGSCVAAGATDQASVCNLCAPEKDAHGWSVKADCCTADAGCPHGGVCDEAKCDKASGKCSLETKPGCCTSDLQCDDGDACTADVCDKASGKCQITPLFCPDPSTCQQGICDAKTGKCTAQLKLGYCMIGFQCVASGTKPAGQPCKACQPQTKTDDWTVTVGAACDDGDSCTESDSCQSSGVCSGKAQAGCCKSDNDCGPPQSPCLVRKCDAKAGVCINQSVPGCCNAGACCDLTNHQVKAAASPCSGAVLATEYQCAGTKVQRRQSHPGCDGKAPDGCSSAPIHQSLGAWETIETCPSNTACTATASGVQPKCVPTGPIGTCSGACGGKTKTTGGTCYCDAACTAVGDCCTDFVGLCGCTSGTCCDVAKKYPKPSGTVCGGTVKTEHQCVGAQIQKRTAQGTCGGTSSTCSTATSALKWSGWTALLTCPAGSVCTVSASKATATCVVTPVGTCAGKCGGQSAGACWCDSACATLGDCCADFGKLCACGANPAKTCNGKCGGQGVGGCWCDTLCADFGDCCDDKPTCCS